MTSHGYQAETDWLGERVLTLADIWPPEPRAMIVGLNPAPRSVAAGHYYQGTSGRRQLDRLVAAGLFPASDGPYFEDAALGAGIGFTDIVKRPSVGERDVTRAEIAHGRTVLTEALAARAVGLVVCVFRHPADALLGTTTKPGMQGARTSWGGQVFRMPGPYASRQDVRDVMGELTRALARSA